MCTDFFWTATISTQEASYFLEVLLEDVVWFIGKIAYNSLKPFSFVQTLCPTAASLSKNQVLDISKADITTGTPKVFGWIDAKDRISKVCRDMCGLLWDYLASSQVRSVGGIWPERHVRTACSGTEAAKMVQKYAYEAENNSVRWSFCRKFDWTFELRLDSAALSDIEILGKWPGPIESIETHGKWLLLSLCHELGKVKHFNPNENLQMPCSARILGSFYAQCKSTRSLIWWYHQRLARNILHGDEAHQTTFQSGVMALLRNKGDWIMLSKCFDQLQKNVKWLFFVFILQSHYFDPCSFEIAESLYWNGSLLSFS